MTQQTVIFASLILVFVSFSKCEKEEETENSKPEINNLVVEGHDDSIHRGEKISYEADIKSNSGAKLDYYHLEIHNEPESGKEEDEYKVEDDECSEDTEGLLNTHLHHHVEVDDSAPTGKYHFYLQVVDQKGYSASAEKEIQIYK